MDEIAVSTVVYLPPDEVYDFLVDFPRYANYSKHLEEVRSDGDGSSGTRYALRFAWWKLTYTAHSEVTDLDPPARIDWRLVKDIHAHGRWRVEPLDEFPADAPPDADAACRVHFEIEFDADTARDGALDLPPLVSFDWVIGKIKPLVLKEAERVVERIVADIEGRERDVELTVRNRPTSV
ncbi:type II toxin-antitoxin system RatA family toxin [Halegenticoccus tardaugens]|uniref:type II toxin-antitoxin system RatA family toxin n=1 Tax=Halegenticoccus tardaugens TaxID=2071624 RepID=UPI00100BBB74|nr:SRPBCC family protein [Halegenticoccus tardaugens]